LRKIGESALETLYASAEKSSQEDIDNENQEINELSYLKILLDSVSEYVIILNKNRQILFANKSFLEYLGIKDVSKILGARFGESMNCIHSSEISGCGTTEYCQVCGAVNSILNCLETGQGEGECRILLKSGDALDLLAKSTSFKINNNEYIILSMADKTDENRRRMLERIFFHDILNNAGGIYGFSDVLNKQFQATSFEGGIANNIFMLSKELIDEIESQKELTSAENKEITVQKEKINSLAIIKFLASKYQLHSLSAEKHIIVSDNSDSIDFERDPVLLKRILGNMTKNAIEASVDNQTITLSCQKTDDTLCFNVHSEPYIPRKIQLLIFKRSFSTKEPGRGLGTYSIKLFGERYLGGKVSFESNEESGTTFSLCLPINN
jgi:nitrogen-specific signal transduction histidine kinase